MVSETPSANLSGKEIWPSLPVAEWQPTRDTLHMWTQIVGKTRLALSPHLNHWWEVPLYVNVRGLTTSPIPYDGGVFEIQFDFNAHQLLIETSAGSRRNLNLAPKSVADFYAEFLDALGALGIAAKIWSVPVEIPNPIRFEQDRTHAAYDPEYAHRFWQVLVSADTIFKQFRSDFLGKCSPVHFFWGSFDLAVTRFSGRRAPARPGADAMTREAYSHEVISAGFWPGAGDTDAVFYSYAAPEPPGFAEAPIEPAAAFYSKTFSEFLLPYKIMREAAQPRDALLAFMHSVYEAGATLGKWDRAELERPHATAAS